MEFTCNDVLKRHVDCSSGICPEIAKGEGQKRLCEGTRIPEIESPESLMVQVLVVALFEIRTSTLSTNSDMGCENSSWRWVGMDPGRTCAYEDKHMNEGNELELGYSNW